MFPIEIVILIAGVLVLLGVASSKLSASMGVPVLVIFLALGMLAGSEGIGRIQFEYYELAYAIGTLALALILFDGGLRTPKISVELCWKPAVLLATVGVFITAVVTGIAASYILGISLLQGLLLGSIVGSTDAAAVFAILRTSGVALPPRLSATLEVESGSNDPMAIFLTIGCIQVLTGEMGSGWGLLWLFVTQMFVGALVGVTIGMLAVRVVNRINLGAAGLYPILVTACGMLAFGLAAWLGGSGFLAVYLAGLVIGNSHLVFKKGIFIYHDAAAWLAQIIMFVVLGLLSFPSRLWAVGWQGLLIAIVLMFIARPVAVFITLAASRFNRRELLLLSWVGLKGAVPITLATFPLIHDVPGAPLLFDAVFFVVLLSVLVQGWTLPAAARQLGLELPAQPKPPVSLEISSLRQVDGDIVDYTVTDDSRATGRRVKDLALPSGVVIALIVRGEELIPPHGSTVIEAGDHAMLVLKPETRPLVDRVFAPRMLYDQELPSMLEFPLRASITVGELEEFYGIKMHAKSTNTLDEAVRERLGTESPTLESMVHFGEIALHVRELNADGTITLVGMVILLDEGFSD